MFARAVLGLAKALGHHLEAIAGFGDLDRAVEGVAMVGGEHGVIARALRGSAPPAHLRLDHGEATARVRVGPGDHRAEDRREVPGGQALFGVPGDTAPEHVDQPDPRLEVVAMGRLRPGIEDRPRFGDQDQR